MRFNYAGNTYVIDFQRAKRSVSQKRATRVKVVTAKYPSTTVFLHKVQTGQTPTLIGSAEVKCWVGDKFSFEGGRKAALRKLSELLRLQARTSGDAAKQFARGLTAAMWDGYLNRVPATKSLKEQLEEANAKILLLTERLKELTPAPKQVEIVDAAEVRIAPAALLPAHVDATESNA